MSSSGQRQLQMNPLERALSTDINRLQQFVGYSLSTLFQALIDNGSGFDDVNAGGAYLVNTTQGSPATGEIVSGLLFLPTGGSTASAVTSGVVFMLDPDTVPSGDDSQFKMIVDLGTTGLALTPNASGSTRIDVIECARSQPDTVFETDSRDVFNTVTGTVSAANVNKVTAAALTYRIRLGTPGAGYPGPAAGWMPLAIASVPTGTTTWDTVTLWDVRPLLEDRSRAPFNAAYDMPRGRGGMFYTFNSTAGFKMSGVVDVAYVDRRLGGRIQRGSPGTDAAGTVDFTDTKNREASMSTADGLKYIYLITLFGLPRWARYTDGPAGRVPRSPRGIPIMSTVGPAHAYGVPSSPITVPASWGFGTATTLNGVCIAAVQMTSGVLVTQVCAAGKVSAALPTSVAGTAFGGGFSSTFALGENTHFPAGVRRLKVVFECTVATTATDILTLDPTVTTNAVGVGITGGSVQFPSSKHFFNPGGNPLTTFTYSWEHWIELDNAYPATTPVTYDVVINFATSGVTAGSTASTPLITVEGWEYGD